MSAALREARVLRDYQVEAADAVLAAWGADTRRVGVVMPTGTGKSTVIAEVAVRASTLGLRVVMLAHRGELLHQMADTVAEVDPAREPVGIVMADQDDHHAQIVAASLQTLVHDHRLHKLGPRDVVLFDEVHHAGAESWLQVIRDLGVYDGGFLCGFTATMRRDDGTPLAEVIDEVVFERSIKWAIEHGHLVQPTGLTVRIPDLDLNAVKTVAGDFAAGELAEVMEASTGTIVDAIVRHAADRRPIVFAAGVDAAHLLADELQRHGMSAEAVTGAMPRDERAEVYARYRSGQTRAMVTVQVLTEGADFPMCDAAILARPTQSKNLFVQMCGRAMRLFPGKADALVLDLVGTTRNMRLATVTDLNAGAQPRVVDENGEDVVEVEDPAEKRVKPKLEGPADLVSVDLLDDRAADNDELWLETDAGGVPFLSYPDEVVFLWPMAHKWQVGHVNLRGAKVGGYLLDSPAPLAEAITAARVYAVKRHGSIPRRNASWRRSGNRPSEAQVRFARTLGIDNPEGKSRARLSDDISVHITSRRLGL